MRNECAANIYETYHVHNHLPKMGNAQLNIAVNYYTYADVDSTQKVNNKLALNVLLIFNKLLGCGPCVMCVWSTCKR